MSERIDLQGIEPREWDIDGGARATIQNLFENPQETPYYLRFGNAWAFRTKRETDGTLVCDIPPASIAGRVNISLWRSEDGNAGDRVLGTDCRFEYRNRSARKV